MGANVIITARNRDRLNETLKLMSAGNHELHTVDLNSEVEISDFVDVLPQLDGLVHCAGLAIPKPFQYYSKENN